MRIQHLIWLLCATMMGWLVLVLTLAPSVRAAGIIVSSTADTTANDSNCTLREAITNANSNAATWSDCAAGSGVDTITFNFTGTIRLSSALPNIADPVDLIIDGVGQSITVSGDTDGNGTADVPLFTVNAGANLSLRNLTLAKGKADSSQCGGAVLNDNGSVIVFGSTITGNQAALSGGGICNRASGTLQVTNSTFSDNTATWGGGIRNSGTLTVTNSTFSNNSVTGVGGGIDHDPGTAVVINSTFSGNSAVWGGGIGISQGTLTVTNSTLSGNTGTDGDNIWNTTGTANLRNTILSTGSSRANCSGTVTNGGNNIDSGTSCGWQSNSSSLSNTNPLLSALANNGGPTQTMALQAASPAIDAGSASICALAWPDGPGGVDQRGVSHKGVCDIGAFELASKLFLPLVLK